MNQRFVSALCCAILCCVLAPAVGFATDLEEVFAGRAPKSVAELKAMEAHVQELSKKVIPCTVGLQIGGAQGSGVIINEEGYILTAAHVSGKPGRKANIILHDGRKIKGKTLGANTGIDAGLVKITTEGDWPFVEMGDSESLKKGQWCLVTGHPGGYQKGRQPPVRLGRILQVTSIGLMTDCLLVGGDSGGPLFDMQGKVIGINSRIGGTLTSNIHVPVATYEETWDRLADSEYWGKDKSKKNQAYLGITVESEGERLRIETVSEDSPAEKAGLQSGDVILRCNQEKIDSVQALLPFVKDSKPGDEITLVVQRGEETLTIPVTLGKRK